MGVVTSRDPFLPRDAMLSSCVCLSHVKSAKLGITHTISHRLELSDAKDLGDIQTGSHFTGMQNVGVVG